MDRRATYGQIFGEIILCILLIYFDVQLLSSNHPWIFPDFANLAIHESGHVIFSPFGMFMQILGGSLFQCLVPILFFIYFLYKKNLFGRFFCIFWLGDNLVNVSVYIKDATAMALPLVGGDGVIHDWHWLLSNTHLLSQDQLIGSFVFWSGITCCTAATILSIVWTGKELNSIVRIL